MNSVVLNGFFMNNEFCKQVKIYHCHNYNEEMKDEIINS